MNEDIRQLIHRVDAFEIDPGEKALGFEHRLARENRWTVAYAQRVMDEYKRFCVLAVASGHHVTPSEAIDQAWHLHLTYTRSYWERFCGETLGRPLHHEPTSGGPSEGVKFHDWYSETLKSYERLFGQSPPQDVWPQPKDRFRHAGSWAWINTGRYWMVPRIYAWPIIATILLIALMVIPGCVPAIAAAGQPAGIFLVPAAVFFPFNLSGGEFLILYGALCTVGLTAVVGLRIAAKADDEHRPSIASQDLTVDELAVLAGGGSRLAYLSLTRLYAERRIEVTKAGWFSSAKLIAKPGTEPITSAIDRDLYTEIKNGKSTNQLLKTIKPHYDRINQKLITMRLRQDSLFHSNAATGIIGAILAVGILRLIQGFWVGQEIGFLVVLTILFPIVAILVNNRRTKVTSTGAAYLKRSQERLGSDRRATVEDQSAGPNKDIVLLNVALLGTAAIAGFDSFGPLAPVFQSMNSNSSSGGCGSGCGSGCGGGGCGGCGGCGG
jgi:uncharacterized protein (TIGR04222 family)